MLRRQGRIRRNERSSTKGTVPGGMLLRSLPVLACFGISSVSGSPIHSYLNQDGVKVLTNLSVPTPTQPRFEESEVGKSQAAFLPLIHATAGRYDIDPDLVRAIIKVESDFQPRAISSKDCKGLMQLHPDTARRFGVKNTFDPAQNIEGGIRYLKFLMGFFNQKLDLVLAGYNAGENAVKRHGGIPPYSETKGYVRKVQALYSSYRQWAAKLAQPSFRIQRIVQSNGRVLLTNTPVR